MKSETLFYIEYKTFQVFTFRMVDVYRMIGWLVELVQNTNLSSGQRSSGKDRVTKVFFSNDLRAAECKKNAAAWHFLHRFLIQARIAFQRIMKCGPVLGKGRRIKDNQVVSVGSVNMVKEFESVLAKSEQNNLLVFCKSVSAWRV